MKPTGTLEARIAAALAEHAVEYVDGAGGDAAVCVCGERFHDDTSAYDCPDDMAPHSAHLAAVIGSLPDVALVTRDGLARAMYLEQAQQHAHSDDTRSPEEGWERGWSFKGLWFDQADRLLTRLRGATS